ncbi:MAG: flagellar hook basal-body protein [Betaproteobacteria bacterium]|nr:flagellar hook basal-body protein [Betaproteobacteria bacterium]
MREVLGVALHALNQDSKRLEAVAVNLANVSTPGYKRTIAVAQSFGEMIDGFASVAGPTRANGVEVPLPPLSMHVDLQAGTLKFTGRELDFAISGKGFFEVMTPDGPAYTRTGDFSLDASGRLLAPQGHPVMGREGEIRLPPVSLRVDRAGNVFDATDTQQTSRPLAQLKVVNIEDQRVQQRLDSGYLVLDSVPADLPTGSISVKQGYLENANVSAMREMLEMMATVRHVETLQKVVNGYDEMMATAVRKLGEGN